MLLTDNEKIMVLYFSLIFAAFNTVSEVGFLFLIVFESDTIIGYGKYEMDE